MFLFVDSRVLYEVCVASVTSKFLHAHSVKSDDMRRVVCVKCVWVGGDNGDQSSDGSVVQEQIVIKFSCFLALFKSLISVAQSL